MPDMLVRLYDLPDTAEAVRAAREQGVTCRRAEAWERSPVIAFVQAHFPHWVDETEVAFRHSPATLFIAIEGREVVGFAAYHAARPNFFGPTGVDKSQRGRGIGRVLLLQCLQAMADEGYAYAIIGGVGPAPFYQKAVGATIIEGSDPGVYTYGLGDTH